MADTTIPSAASATEQTLSNWAAPYVNDLLSKGQALAGTPYQAYTGPLTAGPSGLQTQAFQGLANLTVPTSVTSAAQGAGQIAGQFQGMGGYNPAQFGNQFNASAGQYNPAGFNSGYNPVNPTAGTTQFTNQYNAGAGQYSPTTFGTDTWSTGVAQQYMNPYLQVSLNPQLDQARRQADISRMTDAARLAKAGAYGGTRQAVMESEGRRNLMDIQGQITGRGYDTAYGQALNQFNADEGRQLEALRGTEQSRQFGASQGMTAAELQARYGLSAQEAQERARQFNVGQQMTAADRAASYGMEAQRAGEQSRQFASQQGLAAAQSAAQYGLAGQQAAEASRQFGANYGLSALDKALGAYNTQGQLGLASLGAQRNVLSDQLTAGATQRDIQQQGITADMKQFDQERAYPYEMLQYQKDLLSGMPITTSRSYTASGTDPLAAILTGAGAGGNLANLFQGTK